MKIIRSLRFALGLFTLTSLLTACGGGGSDSTPTQPAPTTYSTTSTKGDYSEWTLTGNQLAATWQVIDTSGGVEHTYSLEATCADPDTKGLQICTLGTVTCTDGLIACPATLPSGDLEIMAVPGVALFARTVTMVDQLHVGFVKDETGCSVDMTGDYTYMLLGVGSEDVFGLYRSDNDFINILHADFGFDTSDANLTQTQRYSTSSEAETLVDNGCASGVRQRTLPSMDAIRLMASASGLMVLDLPSGKGGLLAFNGAQAAGMNDFAGKTFGGISFPDNAAPDFFQADFGAVSGGEVPVTAVFDTLPTTMSLQLQELSATALVSNPAYPDFNVAATGYDSVTSVLASTYPDATTIPGLYKFDGLADAGRVILAGAKFNNKVVAFGAVYNYRNTLDINPANDLPYASDGLYNTGSFIFFEQ